MEKTNTKDLTGMRFGRLVVLNKDASDKNHHAKWKCKCDCGNVVSVYESNLKKGTSSSCGCLAKELMSKRKTKHGGCRNGKETRLYSVWVGMRKRCLSTNSQNWEYYGGRGISICEEWMDFSNFEEWAIKSGYDENASYGACTIDRIDTNGDYCPENCRWVSSKIQQNNRRSCINISYNNETHTLKEWSRIVNIPYPTLYQRYKYGWEESRLLNR